MRSESETAATSAARTDSELWQGVLAGNERAWEQLVRRYEALIYTIATRAGLSLQDAADCFQQTWLQLYKNRKRIKEPHRLSAWLTTTAKRESLRLRRRAKWQVDSDVLPGLPDKKPLADTQLELYEQRARLESALLRLDERCAQLLSALFLEAEPDSYEELAHRLGIPRNSIGPVRSRCLSKMRTILESEGWL